jgi:hypothetical protein
MPKISETLRGLPSQFSAQAQSVNQKIGSPIQSVKTGFLGDNGTFETSDLKPIADNIRQYGLTGGLAKTLLGYFKPETAQTPTTTGGEFPQFNFGSSQPQFNFGYDTTQPTTGTDQYQGFTRYNPFAPTQYDMSGMMQMINTPIANMFQAPASSQGFEPYRPPIPKTGETTVFDFVNKIEAPSGSGLQMTPEGGQQQAPAPTAPKITPSKMPAKSFEETFYNPLFVNNKIDPSKAMTTNKGYFDMGKANTAGGNWIPNVGWYTEADKMAGLKEEDLIFNREMQNRIASMFQ